MGRGSVARLRVTENEKMIMLADSLGWPVIKESFDHDDVIVKDHAGKYVYWRHKGGTITYASDNKGPLPKPLAGNVEKIIRRESLTG